MGYTAITAKTNARVAPHNGRRQTIQTVTHDSLPGSYELCSEGARRVREVRHTTALSWSPPSPSGLHSIPRTLPSSIPTEGQGSHVWMGSKNGLATANLAEQVSSSKVSNRDPNLSSARNGRQQSKTDNDYNGWSADGWARPRSSRPCNLDHPDEERSGSGKLRAISALLQSHGTLPPHAEKSVSGLTSDIDATIAVSPHISGIHAVDQSNTLLDRRTSSKGGPTMRSSSDTASLPDSERSFMGIDDSGSGDDAESMNALCSSFIHDLSQQVLEFGGMQDGGSRQCPAGRSGSHRLPSHNLRVTTSSSSSNQSGGTPTKRSNDSGDAQEEDDDPQAPRFGHKRTRSDENDSARFFACPFSKFDKIRYSERNNGEPEYRTCSSHMLRDIPRVKQHLYRVHMKPANLCPICYDDLKSDQQLAQHIRSRNCESREERHTEKITSAQIREIKKRNRGGHSIQNWFAIFRILFPGAQEPSSPYAGESESDSVTHFVNFFRAYGPELFFQIMRDRQESGRSVHLNVPTQVIVDEAFEIVAPQYLTALRTRQSSLIVASDGRENVRNDAAAVSQLPACASDANGCGEARVKSGPDSPPEIKQYWLKSRDDIVSDGNISNEFDGFFDYQGLDMGSSFDPLSVEVAFDSYGPQRNGHNENEELGESSRLV